MVSSACIGVDNGIIFIYFAPLAERWFPERLRNLSTSLGTPPPSCPSVEEGDDSSTGREGQALAQAGWLDGNVWVAGAGNVWVTGAGN
eukprot:gene23266-13618_t